MNDISSFYQDVAPVFLFTNENVAGALRAMGGVRDANVLTIAGSGDHAFEAYLAGAKYVETFDLNILQDSIMELKTHMIKNLKYSDFMDFFFSDKDFFNTNILKPIYPRFSYMLHTFIKAYHKFGGDSSILRYRNRATHENYRTDMISYVRDEQTYNRLTDILSAKPIFHHMDLDELAQGRMLDKRFDAVLLSNVAEKLARSAIAPCDFVAFFNQYLLPICNKNLNRRNGRICYSYIYGNKTQTNANRAFGRGVVQASDVANNILFSNSVHNYYVTGHCIDSSRRDVVQDAIFVLNQRRR